MLINYNTYPAPTNYPGVITAYFVFDQHVLTTLGQTVVHVRTCMNSMSVSVGEVFIQTTNLIHTLPLLIVSIELVYCLGIN